MSARAAFGRPRILVATEITVASQMAMVLSCLLGIPYVVLIYAEELTTLASGSSARVVSRIDRYIRILSLRKASGFVSVSDFALDQLRQLGVPQPRALKIVPMVPRAQIPTIDEVSRVRTKLGLETADQVVLSVGRLIERKGHDRLLDAWITVRANHPRAKLVIAGRGERETRLRRLATELGLDDSVIFAGFVPDAEIACYYQLCTLMAMPHRALDNGDTEGCPTVFLEANAYGKPVVGGNAGGVSDAIIDGVTGFIVDGNDARAIADAVSLLLSNPALARQLGENGARRVKEELSPVRGGALFADFLDSVSRDI